MQLICPNCGKPVPAANINIQRMTAVCPACDSVFEFDTAAAKAKRRKVKQPDQLALDERDGQLTLAFRTNFRLSQNQDFVATGIMSLFFTFITVMMLLSADNSRDAILIGGLFGLIALAMYYATALVAYNKTIIEVDESSLKVSRKPLLNFLVQPTMLDSASIARVFYEETAASIREKYDLPRYHVWAETHDGRRQLVVKDMIEDYAIFIVQRLTEFLDVDADVDAAPDVSRLVDTDAETDGQLSDEFMPRQASSRT